jgi:hypothetical protein
LEINIINYSNEFFGDFGKIFWVTVEKFKMNGWKFREMVPALLFNGI